jgi:hypothetical protein
MGTLEKTRGGIGLAAVLTLIFGLNVLLYAPLFSTQQRPYKGSIAAGYAGITRFISEHPNPWGWNPQQYAGQPTQFTYPPLLPYAASSIHWVTGTNAAGSYRILTALLACLGPVTLALFFWSATRSLFWTLLLGIAYTIFSPLYGTFTAIDTDRGIYYLPWRLLVLMKYGEGPHVAGLTMLPLILMALRWGASRRDFTSLFVMAIALAVAPLTNWLIGFATALTVVWLLLTDISSWRRILPAGLLGYGLACFWLTPEYISTTLFNWPKDAYGYKVEQAHWPLYAGLIALLLTLHFLMHRYGVPWIVRFGTIGMAAFTYIAGAFYWFQRDTIPESRRYALEMEMFLMLAVFGWCWMAWRSKEGVDKFCVLLGLGFLLVSGLGQWKGTTSRSYASWGLTSQRETLEYRLAEWLHNATPRGRVFTTGALRFQLNAWFPMHQVGGTFESGLRNRIAVDHYYQVRTGEGSKPETESADAMMQLAAIGAQFVIVHGPGSEEYYRDIKRPDKFVPLGPVVYRLGEHDWIHEVPFSSFAHLVKPDEFPKNRWMMALPSYAAAIQDPSRPKLRVVERNPSEWEIQGGFPAGHDVAWSMNWDPGWRAMQGGTAIPVEKSELGLVRLRPAAGSATPILLTYQGTPQQKWFAGISLAVWIGSIALWLRSRSWRDSTSTR